MNYRSFREVNSKIDGFSFLANEALWLIDICKNELKPSQSLRHFIFQAVSRKVIPVRRASLILLCFFKKSSKRQS